MSHFTHDRSALLRQAPQRRSVPLGRNPRRVLRVPRRPRGRARPRRRRQRRSDEEAERSTARARDRRVRAARAQPEFDELTVGGSPGARPHGRRGARDDPRRPARGRDQHHPGDVGDLHLPGVRQGLPAGDLRPRSRSEDQGDRDLAPRGSRSRRRGGGRRAADADDCRGGEEPQLATSSTSLFALTHATEIRAVVDHGDDALRSKLESWAPETRATLARVLAEVA